MWSLSVSVCDWSFGRDYLLDLSTVVSFSHFRLENLKNKYTFLLACAHKHRYTQTSVVNISVFMQTNFFFKIAIKSDFDNKVCTGALMCVCVMFL